VTTYIPENNDFVIALIKLKASEYFIADINAPIDGSLGALEFDGATKRNKPNLAVGDVVFCRVVDYNKFVGARLSCLNKGYSSKNVLGELKGGMIIRGWKKQQKRL
jgi:exosome complex component RRP40